MVNMNNAYFTYSSVIRETLQNIYILRLSFFNHPILLPDKIQTQQFFQLDVRVVVYVYVCSNLVSEREVGRQHLQDLSCLLMNTIGC